MKRETGSKIILAMLIASMLTLGFNVERISAEPETTLYVDPSTTKIPVGNDFTINVIVADVIDLFAFSIYLGYNTTILDFLSVWVPPPFETPIVRVEPDGYIQVSAISRSTSVFGTGALALISFNATAVGECLLDLYDTILFDSTSNFIPHKIIDGSVTVSSGVISPLEALEELIETIEAWNLHKGTENRLTSKLEGALHLLEKRDENGALPKLMVLISQVEALRKKKLTDVQADYLISEAQRIIDLISG